jgi:acyl carrier protein
MQSSDIAHELEAFIRQSFAIADDDPGFSRSVDLFDAGYVDSVGLVETLAHVTQRFGVSIPDDALLSDAFATIEGMAVVIAQLLQQQAAPARHVA